MQVHGTEGGKPDAASLIERSPFRLGALDVNPATRRVNGPAGSSVLRPRVMHVLMVLVDAEQAVVSRDALAAGAWGGRFVAEDSVNGAIAEIRKSLRIAGAAEVTVETVPKAGYRLLWPEHGKPGKEPPESDRNWPTRRLLLAGAFSAVLITGGIFWHGSEATGGEVDDLIAHGTHALRQGLPDKDAQGAASFRRAAALQPDNAKAWGMLALAYRAATEFASPDEAMRMTADAELAAHRALAIDGQQPDAKTALAVLAPWFGRWAEVEDRLRDVLVSAPDHRFASAALATLLMSTGQMKACLQQLNRLIAQDPLSPNLQFRRVYTLWSVGLLKEMDAAADRAFQSWPRHPAVWFARFATLAYTGRTDHARAMLNDASVRPAMPAPVLALNRLLLAALADPRSPAARLAIENHLAAARTGPSPAISAIMLLGKLGAADEAYDVARGFLLNRGPIVVHPRHSSSQPSVTDQHHRMTMMLWIPATESLRLHPNFRELCDGLGMVEYWRDRARSPDFARGGIAAI